MKELIVQLRNVHRTVIQEDNVLMEYVYVNLDILVKVVKILVVLTVVVDMVDVLILNVNVIQAGNMSIVL